MIYRWRARVYPERENGVDFRLQPLELWAPCKARWVWAGTAAKYMSWPSARQGRQRRDATATGEEQLGRCAAGQSKYLAP
jgi:hypothetical protein